MILTKVCWKQNANDKQPLAGDQITNNGQPFTLDLLSSKALSDMLWVCSASGRSFFCKDISDHLRVKLALFRDLCFNILSGFTFGFHYFYFFNH